MIRRLFVVGILFIAAVSSAANIKTKSAQEAEQGRSVYAEAASRQNGWLDMVCKSVEQGASTATDVSSAAQTAASSLVEWVTVRNRALGQPELTDTLADATKTSVSRDLTDIAAETWKNNRGANKQKQTKAITDLKNRLRWKAFEEIQ